MLLVSVQLFLNRGIQVQHEILKLVSGACPGFLKGGGPISLGSLKKRSSDFKRGGSNGQKGGSSTLVSIGRQILHI